MKLSSIIKISSHNMWQNKLRTALTVIVLFVMSTVIMCIAGFAANFLDSANANTKELLKKSGTVMYVYKDYEGVYYDNKKALLQESLSPAEVDSAIEKIENSGLFPIIQLASPNRSMITINSVYENYYAVPFYAGSNIFYGAEDYIADGRMWNEADAEKHNVWLSTGIQGFRVGDKIALNTGLTKEEEFTVCGFINEPKINEGNYPNYYGNSRVYLEKSFFKDAYKQTYQSDSDINTSGYRKALLSIVNVGGSLAKQEGVEYGLATLNKIKALEKELTTKANSKAPGIGATDEFSENQKMFAIIFAVIFGLIGGVSLIIILLSIGCVANTIKITAEQNRKFFGMMKAIGMRNKTVRALVKWQAAMMTFIGASLATAVTYGILQSTKALLTSIMKSMLGQGSDPIVICTISPLVPCLVFFALLGFVLLFTRSSLMAISKKDVISVISEVN